MSSSTTSSCIGIDLEKERGPHITTKYTREVGGKTCQGELSQPKKDVLAKDLNFGGIPSSRPHHGHGICHQEQQADGDRGRTTKAKSIGCVHQSESTTFQPHHPGKESTGIAPNRHHDPAG